MRKTDVDVPQQRCPLKVDDSVIRGGDLEVSFTFSVESLTVRTEGSEAPMLPAQVQDVSEVTSSAGALNRVQNIFLITF
ncbi:hypothetical protein EYF80_029008 [Liparis tanakae]|uniref:Uncharacterized protein n=1 Tax=Liparis tanakae TaxID=230148 RepID=A0A4Z2H7G0_9TELE|nr:hypothetical protein EYF80_029008 [Liparis tanakae]